MRNAKSYVLIEKMPVLRHALQRETKERALEDSQTVQNVYSD